MKLHEILTAKDQLQMVHDYLKHQGFKVQLGSIYVKVIGSASNVHLYCDSDTDLWSITWYKDGRRMGHDDELSFDELEDHLQPLKPAS